MIDFSDFKNAESVFRFFEEISKIPHGSENTSKIADYLVSFAQERGLIYYRDSADNVIIKKAATTGYEKRPTVILQGHTDMVADKSPDCEIDMKKDGLALYRDGDYLRASGTTLGGDDGVAVAYALAILDSEDIAHPGIEAVFTSDEEIGLIGASALDTSMLDGKLMINIDSDVEGIFTVGCAGGMRMDIKLNCKRGEKKATLRKLTVSGLIGGHSGMEIDKGRINAIKVLSEVLGACHAPVIADISGGNADNAIPRNAEAIYTIRDDTKDAMWNLDYSIEHFIIPSVIEKYKGLEPDIKIDYIPVTDEAFVFDAHTSAKILRIINALPSGVRAMSREIEGLVQTSSNLGIMSCDEESVSVSVSLRSSKNSEKDALRNEIREIGEGFSGVVSERGEYPAWEYRKESHLCDVMSRVYSDMYGKSPKIITIHAGLECGIFSEKIDELDCVSIGPDNFDIHTPQEHLSISSTARVFEYLKQVLKEI